MSLDDDNEDGKDEGMRNLRRIGMGLLAAAFFTHEALEILQTGETQYRRFTYKNEGSTAMAAFSAFIACFLHFHYFWAFFPRFAILRTVFSRIGLIGSVIAILFVWIYYARHRNPQAGRDPAVTSQTLTNAARFPLQKSAGKA